MSTNPAPPSTPQPSDDDDDDDRYADVPCTD
jgi:hypothetical protein